MLLLMKDEPEAGITARLVGQHPHQHGHCPTDRSGTAEVVVSMVSQQCHDHHTDSK